MYIDWVVQSTGLGCGCIEDKCFFSVIVDFKSSACILCGSVLCVLDKIGSLAAVSFVPRACEGPNPD